MFWFVCFLGLVSVCFPLENERGARFPEVFGGGKKSLKLARSWDVQSEEDLKESGEFKPKFSSEVESETDLTKSNVEELKSDSGESQSDSEESESDLDESRSDSKEIDSNQSKPELKDFDLSQTKVNVSESDLGESNLKELDLGEAELDSDESESEKKESDLEEMQSNLDESGLKMTEFDLGQSNLDESKLNAPNSFLANETLVASTSHLSLLNQFNKTPLTSVVASNNFSDAILLLVATIDETCRDLTKRITDFYLDVSSTDTILDVLVYANNLFFERVIAYLTFTNAFADEVLYGLLETSRNFARRSKDEVALAGLAEDMAEVAAGFLRSRVALGLASLLLGLLACVDVVEKLLSFLN